jgi:hypothetical protein
MAETEKINFHGDDLHQSILNKSAQDKFLIILDVPPYLKSINDRNERKNSLINLDKWQFSPSSISLPTVSTPAVQVPYGGQTIKMTSQTRPAYTPLKLSFQIDNNFDNYHFLWVWQAVMNDPLKSFMDPYWDELKGNPYKDTPLFEHGLASKQMKYKHDFTEYKSKIVVLGLREYNEPIVKFTFNEAFPVEVSGIEYDYKNHELLNSTATFEFNQMNVELLDFIPNEVEDLGGKHKHEP